MSDDKILNKELMQQFNKEDGLNFQQFIDWCCSNHLEFTMESLNKYIEESKNV